MSLSSPTSMVLVGSKGVWSWEVEQRMGRRKLIWRGKPEE